MDYKQICKDFLGIEIQEEVAPVVTPLRIRKAYRPHSDEQMFGMLKDGKLEDLKKALEENIRFEAEQNKGASKSELSCIKRIVDAKSNNKALRYANEFEMGGEKWFGFCNGHYVLAGHEDYGYEHAENPLKLADFFKGTMDVRIPIDMADLRTFAKTHKAKRGVNPNPYIINLDDGKILGCNPHYLLNALEFCGESSIWVSREFVTEADYCYKKQFQISSEKNIAMLLPVNIVKK